MSFKGRYFFHFGEEYSQHGKVVDQFDGVLLLQRLDDRDDDLLDKALSKASPMLAVPIKTVLEEFSDKNGAPTGEWQFFETEEALISYLTYIGIDSSDPDEEEQEPSAPQLQ